MWFHFIFPNGLKTKKHKNNYKYCVQAKSLQLCLTLSDFIEYSQTSSSVHMILQARILEWVASLPPGDLPNMAIEPSSLTIPALVGRFSTTWRRKWQPIPVFFPGEFHGQRTLVVYSPWDHKESDMIELLTHYLPTGTTWEAQICVIGHKIWFINL